MLDFPNTPTTGTTYTVGGVTWRYDGVKWTTSTGSGGPYLPLAGGTMSGTLTLAGDPTADLQAADKHYVDSSINLAGNYLGTWAVASNTPSITAGGSISNANYVATTTNPATPETAPAGIPGIAGMTINNGDRIIWAAGLGVWQILRNAGMTQAAADARYYNISNPSGYQTAANVTTALAPYAPLAAPVFTGDARAVTPSYGDSDTSIATTAFVQAAIAPAQGNVGRNLLHNSVFAVAQRGAGPWTASSSYTADRWQLFLATDTATIQLVSLTDADRAQIGDEQATTALQANVTGTASGASVIFQRMENVRRFGGKTLILSFWARSITGGTGLGIGIDQSFGTGGSPSAAVGGPQTWLTLTNVFVRYSVTTTLPSVAGKTLGTNGDSSAVLNFIYSATGHVQTANIQLWGVQLEIAQPGQTQPTPLEKRDPAEDLSLCQRFYYTGYFNFWGYNNAAATCTMYIAFPDTMRTAATITLGTASTSSNVSNPVLAGHLSGRGATLQLAPTATGAFGYNNSFTASADL